MSADATMQIGELARLTGVSASALRYYERIGLLAPADRVGQRRQYRAESMERVGLIRLYQDAGFTLEEIRLVLTARSPRSGAWGDVAERKIAELDARIADTQRAKQLVQHALECPHPDLHSCPNFRSALEARLEHAARPHE